MIKYYQQCKWMRVIVVTAYHNVNNAKGQSVRMNRESFALHSALHVCDCRYGISPVNYPDPDVFENHHSYTYMY